MLYEMRERVVLYRMYERIVCQHLVNCMKCFLPRSIRDSSTELTYVVEVRKYHTYLFRPLYNSWLLPFTCYVYVLSKELISMRMRMRY